MCVFEYQGLGNAVAGIFGGIPSAGATMRTVVNIRSGGKTRWVDSGLFCITGHVCKCIPNKAHLIYIGWLEWSTQLFC